MYNVLLWVQLLNHLLLKMYFDEKTASEVFRKLWLEGRYDFFIEDLVTLGNAFAEAAKPKILQETVVKELQEIRDGL